MNKFIALILMASLVLTGCSSASYQTATSEPTLVPTETAIPTLTATASPQPTATPYSVDDVIEYEMRGSFDFFWEEANTDLNSPGYGLIRDRYPGSGGIASMASVGFGLTGYMVGVEKGYITQQQGYDRANKTMDTLLAMDREHGFYYHFVSMDTGKRAWNSEVSTIDTSLLLMGVLSAGQYFGGDVAAKARQIYDGVDWPWFIDKSNNMFYMAYYPDKGFQGHWDFYAEQLMMYVLAAGSETHPIDASTYYAFTRHYGKYGAGDKFIHSWFGSLFTYQYSHAWIDFRGYTDKEGVNWFDNSVNASLAQVSFATNMDNKYITLGPDAWGLSACDGPEGYNGLYGAPPSGYDNNQHVVDDTIPPSAAIGSIIFVPDDSIRAMMNYYSIEKLKGKYGFYDAYNLTKDWYDTDVIGIDKGITLLMLANYQNDIVHKVVMQNKSILNGMNRLQFTKK